MVEDETSITEPLSEALQREGFATEVARTAAEALRVAARTHPDLVLLDVMLPDGSGYDVCRSLREQSEVPIIMLTARGEETDRVVGLELGADDYIVKPFSAREVAARIRAVLRRSAGGQRSAAERDKPLAAGSLTLDPGRRSATHNGQELELTRKEFELLELLLREAGSVITSRTPARRGVGRELVRFHQDARRPHFEPAPQARRRLRGTPLHPHRSRRRLPL